MANKTNVDIYVHASELYVEYNATYVVYDGKIAFRSLSANWLLVVVAVVVVVVVVVLLF